MSPVPPLVVITRLLAPLGTSMEKYCCALVAPASPDTATPFRSGVVPPARLLSKVAVTACAADMVTVQVPVPLQAPDQPVKLEPLAGVALSVTLAPETKLAVQVAPQSMPDGELETVPVPDPARVIVRP